MVKRAVRKGAENGNAGSLVIVTAGPTAADDGGVLAHDVADDADDLALDDLPDGALFLRYREHRGNFLLPKPTWALVKEQAKAKTLTAGLYVSALLIHYMQHSGFFGTPQRGVQFIPAFPLVPITDDAIGQNAMTMYSLWADMSYWTANMQQPNNKRVTRRQLMYSLLTHVSKRPPVFDPRALLIERVNQS